MLAEISSSLFSADRFVWASIFACLSLLMIIFCSGLAKNIKENNAKSTLCSVGMIVIAAVAIAGHLSSFVPAK